MEATGYFFLGLDEREACIAFRKSRLMLASNFLVGTFFSSSRFCLSFIDRHPKSELFLTTRDRLIPLAVSSKPHIHLLVRVATACTLRWCGLFIISGVESN